MPASPTETLTAPTTFREYQALAMRTAVYPAHARVQYPALKLAGEAGEAAGKLLALRRAEPEHPDQPTALQALHAELGDVLWYVAALTRDLGVRDGWLDQPLDALQSRGVERWRAQVDGHADTLAATTLLLAATATQAAERYGKLLRDVPGFTSERLSEAARATLAEIAVDTLTLVALIALAAGSDLATLTQANVEKLASRHARGVLNGSGDTR